jgi:hypothetical protein
MSRRIAMELSFARRVLLPTQVLMREVGGESVLLNLHNENYYGLDETGTRMLTLLTTSESIADAFRVLLTEYDVAPDILERDIRELIEKLVASGLLELGGE